ncbi:MAG: NAD(P)/FAD-dependent oxidoreductase [bacterium]|nr:NAD(P)/FAD-dependent oxidoreductase [bacterium]
MDHIVIIGNGIAGITTARQIRKHSDHKITVISGETEHFFSRTALMYIYMGHMKYENTKPYEDWFWTKNKIDLKKAWVKKVNYSNKTLEFEGGESMQYDKLVLATGSKSNKFGWPGQDLEGVRGLYSYQDLEYMEKHSKDIDRAVVVGGGLIGVEMAEMFHSRNIPVTFLVRETNFWNNILPEEESKLINRHLFEHHIDLRLATELKEIVSDENGRVKSIITGTGEEIACQFVGLTPGVSPNVDFLKESELNIERGIVVNEYLETNIPDVYAAGDCAQVAEPLSHRRAIEAVWYVGRMMGEALGKTLSGQKTAYKPGIWFNSAKFFDIEYQTYGLVGNKLQDNEGQFYWEAEDGKKCVKIVFDQASKKVIGVNTFGIRMRHEVWDKWLKEGKTLNHVIANLDEANFDPEFFKRYDPEIQKAYNGQFPDEQVSVRSRSLLERIFS